MLFMTNRCLSWGWKPSCLPSTAEWILLLYCLLPRIWLPALRRRIRPFTRHLLL